MNQVWTTKNSRMFLVKTDNTATARYFWWSGIDDIHWTPDMKGEAYLVGYMPLAHDTFKEINEGDEVHILQDCVADVTRYDIDSVCIVLGNIKNVKFTMNDTVTIADDLPVTIHVEFKCVVEFRKMSDAS